ncbi:hypothetical protein [Chiayiivirga flava]|uniref:DUF1508 domain-containing protein n=1 Tax=Chiayiivirga flava TaxID=659595 RepID=A0A7W8D7S1_9GAMM|nr:hypothetical protein [Chiayiivirga flava]MBB5208292.1 hypothetical protein [Chiayiivirga flava]
MDQHFPHYEIFETIGEEGFQWRYRGASGELVAFSAARFRTYADCMDSLNKMRQADDVALYVPTRFALARPTTIEPQLPPRAPPRRKGTNPPRRGRPLAGSMAR